jgi:hypothetical protein
VRGDSGAVDVDLCIWGVALWCIEKRRDSHIGSDAQGLHEFAFKLANAAAHSWTIASKCTRGH